MVARGARTTLLVVALVVTVVAALLLAVCLASVWRTAKDQRRALASSGAAPASFRACPACPACPAPVVQRVVVETPPTAPAVFPQIGYLRPTSDDFDSDADDTDDEPEKPFDRSDRDRLAPDTPKPSRRRGAARSGAPLALYARPSFARRSRWYYYAIVAGVKVPVHVEGRDCMAEVGCEELLGGELVRVPASRTVYRVHLYKFDRT
jgi:hypothetical protein